MGNPPISPGPDPGIDSDAKNGGKPLLALELRPNCSLAPRAFIILMAFISVICLVTGLAFTLLGAWPVLGFFALDVLIIYTAFHISYRRASLREWILLRPHLLELRRREIDGTETRFSFNPYWLRIEHIEQDRGGGKLVLASHGRRVGFAAFLPSQQRHRLAKTLRRAQRETNSAF